MEASKAYPEKIQVWFWDESGFSLRVSRRQTWGKKGQPKKVTGKRSRGRVNIMGGLRFYEKKSRCYFREKGTIESFYEQLKQLNNFVKNEYVPPSNNELKFPELGPKVLIVLDHASYYKKKTVLAEIGKNLPNIQLYFLPEYSPIRFS